VTSEKLLRRIRSRRSLATTSQSENGQQMIEFTFTFIILILLFAAMLILGWVFYTYATLTNAAREGSRHLMTHPTIPEDPDRFATSDLETTWIVTNSLPMLDWRPMVVNISPPVAQRVPGGYVAVEVVYTLNMPRLEIPLTLGDRVIGLGGPTPLRALSRRSLD